MSETTYSGRGTSRGEKGTAEGYTAHVPGETSDSAYSRGESIKPGTYVFAKDGVTINFYTDDKGQYIVGPQGGKKGQTNAPSRKGPEYIGTATGNRRNGFVEVDWVNTWWQNGIPKGERKEVLMKSWVKEVSIDFETEYVTADQREVKEKQDQLLKEFAEGTSGGGGGGGMDTTTTIGILAVGVAFLVSRKKGKK